MIQLIIGNKGSGKTKRLISMVEEAVNASNGNVVCVEKSSVLTYDLTHKARLVDAEAYDISGFDKLFGFLCGILAGNYDITHLFVDATFRIGGRDYQAFSDMVKRLDVLTKDHGVAVTFTVSCDLSDLPEEMAAFAI